MVPLHRLYRAAGDDHFFTTNQQEIEVAVQNDKDATYEGIACYVASAALNFQSGWKICTKCNVLAFSGGAAGTCAGGGTHDFGGAQSLKVSLLHGEVPASANSQNNWRWCRKCQSLSFGVGANVCPAGGQHDHSGSSEYTLAQNSGGYIGQNIWKWCRKCQCLTAGPDSHRLSVCPAGGQHDYTGSGNYTVVGEKTVDGQLAPLYRLYRHGGDNHFYTTNIDERNHAFTLGYNDEGIACYVYLADVHELQLGEKSKLNRRIPCWRLYKEAEPDDDGFTFSTLMQILGTAAVIGGLIAFWSSPGKKCANNNQDGSFTISQCKDDPSR